LFAPGALGRKAVAMTGENHRVKAAWPNKPNSAKPAIALQFHFGGLWRGLADSERYATRVSTLTRIAKALKTHSATLLSINT
jgi:hypothetical protein